MSKLAFGVVAASGAQHALLGTAVERLGYEELWVNDTRRGDGLATLAAIAPGTTVLRFGVGVIPLSEYTPEQVAARVRAAGVPMDRLTLGVGSGSTASLRLVVDGVARLRELLPDTPLAVAAVGPGMARVAGEIADAVVTNWAIPDRLASLRQRIAEGAQTAARPQPRFVAYVRTTVGPGAKERLRSEMDRYRTYAGGQYARAFDERPHELVGIAAETTDRAVIRPMLTPYEAVVDTLVVRGVPAEDAIERWLEIAETAAVLTTT